MIGCFYDLDISNKQMNDDKDYLNALDSLGQIIATKRQEAVRARKDSGIEEVWLSAEEAYLGIDDANRQEFASARWAKPMSMQGPVESERNPRRDDARSTLFVPITRRYVDAGSAKLSEILLPIDDKAFSFGPTPIPEIAGYENDLRPAVDDSGNPIIGTQNQAVAPQIPAQGAQMPAMAGNAPVGPVSSPQGGQQAPQPVTIGDLAAKVLAEAKDRADKAETRIYDWMVQCNYRGENRKVIFDSARLGTGVLKGPFPNIEKGKASRKVPGGVEIEIVEKIIPAAKWVDVWNIYPDPACGEDIHDGDFVFERDYLSERKLRELKRKGYISEQIDKAIALGPERINLDSSNPSDQKTKKRYEVWYYYGTISRKDMQSANADALKDLPDGVDQIYAIVTVVNDYVIKATLNPLESGNFPFHVMCWSRRAGYWAGCGIAEQMSAAQRMVNGATRALMNNAGLSAGVQIIIDRDAIEPASGGPSGWAITPNKIWLKSPDSLYDDVRKAMAFLQVPNVVNEMMAIIEYGMKMAEESTSIPLVTQGQTGPTTPETLGATELQNNNANTLLRSIGYTYDECITEPIVNDFYEWLLLDPNVPEDEKGDFEINARGSAAMVERAIQDSTLAQMGQLVLNPSFAVDPKKWFAEWLKSKRLDPSKLQYTEQEQAQMAQAPQQPPTEIQVAQIKSQTDLQIAQMRTGQGGQAQGKDQTARAQAELTKAQMTQQSDMAELQAKADEAERQRQHDLQMKQIEMQMLQMRFEQERYLKQLDIQSEDKARLDTVKADLAQTTISEDTKRELAAQETELALTLDANAKDHDLTMNPPSLIRDEMSTNETP